MKLTWRDAVTTVAMAAVVAVYVAFLTDAGWPLLGSVRGTTGVILFLGIFGGCAIAGVGAQYQEAQTPANRGLLAVASVLGFVALCAAGYALVNASTIALAILFGATVALWLVATARHAFATSAPTMGGRRGDEVIEPLHTVPK